jgi:hypothetical protein
VKDEMDDGEPPGFQCQFGNRHFGRDIYKASDGATPGAGGIDQHGNRGPQLLLNYLVRSGHVLYLPGNGRMLCGNGMHGGA